MSYVTAKDGTQIYYKDWGKGPVVTFSHGWPLNSLHSTASAVLRMIDVAMDGQAKPHRETT
jgi:pimeloyl-ACP methyl ester carboxylesterase